MEQARTGIRGGRGFRTTFPRLRAPVGLWPEGTEPWRDKDCPGLFPPLADGETEAQRGQGVVRAIQQVGEGSGPGRR